MENIDIYEVKIDRKTYTVLSANTPFYAFIGDRLYRTFGQLLAEEDAQRLGEYIANEKNILLSLIDQSGNSRKYLAMLDVGETTVDIRLILLDEIQNWERQMRYSADRKTSILEMYNDFYFEYDAVIDNMRVYSVNLSEVDVVSGTLADFEKTICEYSGYKNEGEIKKFILALQMGNRRFAMNIEGNILNVEGARYALAKGISYYENDKYIYSTGFIHIWNEKTRNAKRILERDYLTGVLTKAEITNLAVDTIDVKKTSNVTMAIIDIDFFKKVNDVLGHMVGDEVLKKVASIIEKEVKEDGVVGRFGGDEFLALFYNAYDMETMRERLRSIRTKVASAFTREESNGVSITLSIGCAAYPKDADSYEDLFLLADFALYRAKEKGRDRYIIYNRDKHGSLDKIRHERMSPNTLNNRGSMTPAELVCAMMDRVYTGIEYSLEALLDDVAVNFNIQRVMLYAGQPYKLVKMAGQRRLSEETIRTTVDYLSDEVLLNTYDSKGMIIMDNVLRFEKSSPTVYEKLRRQGIVSFVHVKFKDRNGTDAILSLEVVNNKPMTWNQSLMPYYRLLAKLLEQYVVE